MGILKVGFLEKHDLQMRYHTRPVFSGHNGLSFGKLSFCRLRMTQTIHALSNVSRQWCPKICPLFQYSVMWRIKSPPYSVTHQKVPSLLVLFWCLIQLTHNWAMLRLYCICTIHSVTFKKINVIRWAYWFVLIWVVEPVHLHRYGNTTTEFQCIHI